MVSLSLPVILVVGMKLGCINHTLLTLNAMKKSGAQCCGWIANRIDPDMEVVEENIATLQHFIATPCLGVIPFQQPAENHLSIEPLIALI